MPAGAARSDFFTEITLALGSAFLSPKVSAVAGHRLQKDASNRGGGDREPDLTEFRDPRSRGDHDVANKSTVLLIL